MHRLLALLLLAALPACATRDFIDDAGRGNTANVEVVLQAKPAVGERREGGVGGAHVHDEVVQQQTGIPCILLDGRAGAHHRTQGLESVVLCDPPVIVTNDPNFHRLVGLLRLSEILYRDPFKHDLRKEVATFYKLFYHREPTAQQVDALLGEPGVAPR